MWKRGQPFTKRTRYILGGTLVFAVGEFLIFLPFFWPIPFTLRAAVSLVLVMLIAIVCGLFVSWMTWKALVGLGFAAPK